MNYSWANPPVSLWHHGFLPTEVTIPEVIVIGSVTVSFADNSWQVVSSPRPQRQASRPGREKSPSSFWPIFAILQISMPKCNRRCMLLRLLGLGRCWDPKENRKKPWLHEVRAHRPGWVIQSELQSELRLHKKGLRTSKWQKILHKGAWSGVLVYFQPQTWSKWFSYELGRMRLRGTKKQHRRVIS